MIPLPSLFDDQMPLVQEVRSNLRSHRSVLLQSPTGSGKSRMGAWMTASSLNKGGSVWFDVPMKELRKQISNTFTELDIPHSFIASGQPYNGLSKCFVTTTATVANALDRVKPPTILILDEAHQGGAARNRLIDWALEHGVYIIHLTATPERLDGKAIRADVMVKGQSIRWLIDNKRLSDYRLFAPSQPDLSALRMAANGEYNQNDVAGFMESQAVLIGDAVKHYKQFAMGRRHISYCASIKHSHMVCQAFKDAGIPSAHIDGTMNDADRLRIIKAYARRELLHISNADLLLYGFDLAAASGDKNATVESISDLKPTMSKAMQWQKNGRALRYKPEAALIFDHAGNSFNADGSIKHGLPCRDVDWNWQGKERKKGQAAEKTIAVRQCPISEGGCGFVHRPSPACPSCGRVYPVAGRVLREEEGELLEISVREFTDVKKEERKLQGRAQTLEELKNLEKLKGYKPGWALKVYNGRKGR